LRDKRSDAPGSLERIVDRCLQRDMDARFANVGRLARALEPLGSTFAKLSTSRIQSAIGAAGPAGQTLLHASPQDESDSLSGATWSGTSLGGSSRRRLIVGLSVTTTLACAIAVAAWLMWGPRQTPAASSADRGTRPSPSIGAAAPGSSAGAASPPSTAAPAAAPPEEHAKVGPGQSAAVRPSAPAGDVTSGQRPVAAPAPTRAGGMAAGNPAVSSGVPTGPGPQPKPARKGTSEDDMLKERH
jgi:serine/threonine-protein kinase